MSLEGSGVGTAGGLALAAAIATEECRLTALNLSWNGLGDGAGRALAQALASKHCRLSNLNLAYNGKIEEGKLSREVEDELCSFYGVILDSRTKKQSWEWCDPCHC